MRIILLFLLVLTAAAAEFQPRVVNTMAELLELQPTPSRPMVEVLGYYEAGDGGGGTYIQTNSITGTNDFGGKVLALGGDKSWQLNPVNNTVTSRQFGLTSGTSNLLAMQAWIDYAASGLFVAFADAGEYGLTNSLVLPSNTYLDGTPDSKFLRMGVASQTNSHIYAAIRTADTFNPYLTANGNGATVNVTTTNITIRNITIGTMPGYFSSFGLAMFQTRDVWIDGVTINTLTNHWALTVFGDKTRISNVKIRNSGAIFQDGIHFVGGDGLVINGGDIESGDDSLAFSSGYSTQTDIKNVTVSGTRVNSSHAHAVRMFIENPSGTNYISNIHVSGLVGSAGQNRNAVVRLESVSTNLLYGITNVTLRGLRINHGGLAGHGGTPQGSAYGYHIHRADRVLLEDCHLGYSPYWNWYIASNGIVTIKDCTSLGAQGSFLGATFFAKENEKLDIIGGNYGHLDTVDSDTIQLTDNGEVNIVGAFIENDYALRSGITFGPVKSDNVLISDCTVTNTTGYGITSYYNPDSIRLIDNRVASVNSAIVWQGGSPPAASVIWGNIGIAGGGTISGSTFEVTTSAGSYVGQLDNKSTYLRLIATNAMLLLSRNGTTGVNEDFRIALESKSGSDLPPLLATILDSGANPEITWGGGSGLGSAVSVQKWSLAASSYGSSVERARLTTGGLRLEPGGVSGNVDASSVFHVVATDKGARHTPAMTTAQRLAIASPSSSLFAFDNDLTAPFVVRGSGGTNAWRTMAPRMLSNVGDADVTLGGWHSGFTVPFETTLTANRTITLSTSGAVNGDTITIVRSGLGSFTLDVGGLKTIPSATAATVVVQFNGSAWRLVGYQLL